jgi:hypothetical protein
LAESQGRFRRDCPLTVDDLRDAVCGHAQCSTERGRADAQLLKLIRVQVSSTEEHCCTRHRAPGSGLQSRPATPSRGYLTLDERLAACSSLPVADIWNENSNLREMVCHGKLMTRPQLLRRLGAGAAFGSSLRVFRP